MPKCIAHLVHREAPTETIGHICERHSHAPAGNRDLAIELHSLDCAVPCLDC
jgi:hypothetical protein